MQCWIPYLQALKNRVSIFQGAANDVVLKSKAIASAVLLDPIVIAHVAGKRFLCMPTQNDSDPNVYISGVQILDTQM